MASHPQIERIDLIRFEMARAAAPEGTRAGNRVLHAIRVFADTGVHGAFVNQRANAAVDFAAIALVAEALLGRNALAHESIYADLRHQTRSMAGVGVGSIDIALWDLAGRHFGAPIHQLLGGERTRLPAYVATTHGTAGGGVLDTPEQFADFALRIRERGFGAFKIHPWRRAPIAQEVANVLEVRRRVGDELQLMLDPANAYETFADAVRVGRACDEAGYFWYEDPLRDGGVSHFAHRKLRQLIATPLLMAEQVRTPAAHLDYLLADATDYIRADVLQDGITGTMKLAHAADALGIDVELHSAGPAQRQCMAAIRNSNYYELSGIHPSGVNLNHAPVYGGGDGEPYEDSLDAADEQGRFTVPTGPGLGVHYDWHTIERNAVHTQTFA